MLIVSPVTESSKSTDDLKNVEVAPEADLAAAKKFRKHAFKGNGVCLHYVLAW